jgi:hypothetical protein
MLSAVRRRLVAISVACTLWPAPALLAAEPAPAPAAEDPLTRAKALHAEGQADFDVGNYDAAIDSWTKAYKVLPSDDGAYRPFILYNIAAAREKLYELHRDVTHLRQAKILLERFDQSIDDLYGDDPPKAESERSRVRDKIAELDARMAQHESATKTEPVPKPEPVPTTTTVTPTRTDEPKPDKRAVGLTVGGGVLIGVGLAAAGGGIAAAVISKQANDISDIPDDDTEARADQFAKGERANKAAIAMAIVSPLFLAGGIAMLVIGAKRAKQKNVSFTPTFGGRFAGAVLRGRF